MALGFFKDPHKKVIEETLEKIHQSIFPNGETDISRDVARVTRLTHGKIPGNKVRGFVTGAKCLVFISTSHEQNSFIESFKIRSENLISSAEAWDVYAYFEGEAAYFDQCSLLYKSKGIPIPDMIRRQFAEVSEIFSKGSYNDFIDGGSGEFGLTKTNPIPTLSIKSSNRYLSKLRYNGKPVENRRVGSTHADITPGSIDIYKLSLEGSELSTIYICPYHKRNSRWAPNGFTIA